MREESLVAGEGVAKPREPVRPAERGEAPFAVGLGGEGLAQDAVGPVADGHGCQHQPGQQGCVDPGEDRVRRGDDRDERRAAPRPRDGRRDDARAQVEADADLPPLGVADAAEEMPVEDDELVRRGLPLTGDMRALPNRGDAPPLGEPRGAGALRPVGGSLQEGPKVHQGTP
jgi:hypothetical protein